MFNRKNTTRPKTKQRSPIDHSALRRAGRVADRTGTSLFRRMIKDHSNATGIADTLLQKPTSGFWAGLRYVLLYFLITVGWALARVLLIVILYIIWIPILIWLFIYFLTH